MLGVEKPKEKKYKPLFHSGSFKEQVPKKALQYGAPEPSLWTTAQHILQTIMTPVLNLVVSLSRNSTLTYQGPFMAFYILGGLGQTQRAQYPSITEHSLQHKMKPVMT